MFILSSSGNILIKNSGTGFWGICRKMYTVVINDRMSLWCCRDIARYSLFTNRCKCINIYLWSVLKLTGNTLLTIRLAESK
jgi:hypothetical protein